MSAKAAKVLTEALQLSEAERLRLADQLYGSLEPADGTTEEISVAWDIEIARRVKALESGEAKLVAGKDVFARIRAEYKR